GAAVAATAAAGGAPGGDGLMWQSTSIERGAVAGHRHAGEAGGLSGAPVFGRSAAVLRAMRARLPELPMIGVGGITDGATAGAKREAGASLVQLYTGLVYRGPALIGECVEGLR